MNTDTPVEALKNLKDGYVLMKDFYTHMMSMNSPYQCNFSLKPFMEKMKEKLPKQDSPIGLMIETLEQQILKSADDPFLEENKPLLETIISLLFPSLFFEGQLGFISVPFSKRFIYMTPALEKLMLGEEFEIKIPEWIQQGKTDKANLDIANLVLNLFYDQDIDIIYSETLRIRNRETHLERYYKINLIKDYVEAITVKPLKKLSDKEIHHLLDNFEDTDLWLEYLPPENFLFEGMVIGYMQDVTDVEILSKIKEMMAKEEGKTNHMNELTFIENGTRSYLHMPEVKIGMLATKESFWQEGTTWSLLRKFDSNIMNPSFEKPYGAYYKALNSKQRVIISDLKEEKQLSKIEERLLERGERSLMLAPMYGSDGSIISLFEMSSSIPYRFNKLTLLKMEDMVALFEMGSNKFIQELESSTRITMQQQFTSIHPSVEWRFREVATKFYWQQSVDGEHAILENIVFKDVYPLYAQADIVGSSKIRNQSIEADLTDNLKRVIEVMAAVRKAVPFHLIDVYLGKAQNNLERLNRGEYISNDESHIVELLTKEIHPLLKELFNRYPQIPKEKIQNYFNYLDKDLNIVYRHRKAYEDSVSQLNATMAHYIEAEDEKMQKILPHFFEKYTTDGVEYNIYLGQSLLEKESFHPFFLKDFRLWQLLHMCELTRLVEKTKNELPVPLTTAQLIFVFNNFMSIRFNMEEKQFDVDGAYNVRYEILKKRIDKARIKATGERLTVSGKIAIVWIQEKDRVEYLEYINHLINQGYITDEVEDLELEKMQGVDGLRALRVTVI